MELINQLRADKKLMDEIWKRWGTWYLGPILAALEKASAEEDAARLQAANEAERQMRKSTDDAPW